MLFFFLSVFVHLDFRLSGVIVLVVEVSHVLFIIDRKLGRSVSW